MSSKNLNYKQKLLQNIDNFINELCNIFPSSSDILSFREKYSIIRSANSNLIVEYFIQYVYPFKQRIMAQDDTFFLDGGGQEELKNESGLTFRDNIKKLWVSELSSENKEIIWKYFKTFVLLSEKYIIENLN